MTVFKKTAEPKLTKTISEGWADVEIGLRQVQLVQTPGEPPALSMEFEFTQPRPGFVWAALKIENSATSHVLRMGLCAPHVQEGSYHEYRPFSLPSWLPGGRYRVSAIFYDHIAALWEPSNPSRFQRFYTLGEMELPNTK